MGEFVKDFRGGRGGTEGGEEALACVVSKDDQETRSTIFTIMLCTPLLLLSRQYTGNSDMAVGGRSRG